MEKALDKIQSLEATEEVLRAIINMRNTQSDGESKGNNPMPIDILKKEKAFYIFTDTFPRKYISDDDIRFFEFYGNNQDLCKYHKRLLMPIRDIEDKIVAFNAYVKAEGLPKYQLTSKRVWNKSKYFYARKWDYTEALSRGYVNVCDGSFDKLRLNTIDEPCWGFLGSTLSDEQIAMLRAVGTIIVHPDNDIAGMKLVGKLKRTAGLTVKVILRDKGKDVDDFLAINKENEKLLKSAINGYRYKNKIMNTYLNSKERIA